MQVALATTVLWNRFCVVLLSVVCHGRAIPWLWQTLEHPSASLSAEVIIALLQRADRLLADTWIHGIAAPMGCELRRLRLPRGDCRGSRDGQLWGDGRQRTNLVLVRPIGMAASEPWYLVSSLDPSLDLVWADGQRFCCEQLFRHPTSGIVQLERSLQGYAISLAGKRCRVDPHWRRGLSFARIGLHWLQQSVIKAGHALLAWMPIPRQTLESCVPSRAVRRRQKRPWFARIALPPPLQRTPPMAVA